MSFAYRSSGIIMANQSETIPAVNNKLNTCLQSDLTGQLPTKDTGESQQFISTYFTDNLDYKRHLTSRLDLLHS